MRRTPRRLYDRARREFLGTLPGEAGIDYLLLDAEVTGTVESIKLVAEDAGFLWLEGGHFHLALREHEYVVPVVDFRYEPLRRDGRVVALLLQFPPGAGDPPSPFGPGGERRAEAGGTESMGREEGAAPRAGEVDDPYAPPEAVETPERMVRIAATMKYPGRQRGISSFPGQRAAWGQAVLEAMAARAREAEGAN